MAEKIDMSLDDIIKMEGISSGRRRSGPGGKQGQSRRGKSNNIGNLVNKTRGGGIIKNKLRSNRLTPYTRASRIPDKWQHDMFEGSSRGGLTQLLVSNLDYGVSDADITDLFSDFGSLRKASVHYDRSGRSLGTADVIFERRNDAIAAIEHYKGITLDGRLLKIQLVPGEGSNRGAGGSGVFLSGKFGSARKKNRGRGGGQFGARNRRGPARATLTAEELDADLDAYVHK